MQNDNQKKIEFDYTDTPQVMQPKYPPKFRHLRNMSCVN